MVGYPDLTLEGNVIFIAALALLLRGWGIAPIGSLLLCAVVGCLVGAFTALQACYLGVSKLLSGIITASILYSLSIHLMGGWSNARISSSETLFTEFVTGRSAFSDLCLASTLLVLVVVALWAVFQTKLGSLLRALGDNEQYVIALGYNPRTLTIIGLALANGITAVGAAILTEFRTSADVNMSSGLLIAALTAVTVGEVIVPSRRLSVYFASLCVGTIVYNCVITAALFGWSASWSRYVYSSDTKLFTGVLLIVLAILRKSRPHRYKLFRSDW